MDNHLEASGLKPIYVDEDTDIEYELRRQETNTEFMTRIMNYGCPTGALIQPFVLEAITRYATNCIAVEQEPEDWPQMLSFEAWKTTALWVKSELEKKYG